MSTSVAKSSASSKPVTRPARRYPWQRWAMVVAILIVFLVIWQLSSGTLISPLFISSPIAVAVRMVVLIQTNVLLPNAWVTLSQALTGFAVGAVAGIIIGNVMGLLRRVGNVASPFVTFFYTLPRIAIAPLFVIWLGVGFNFKAAFVTFVVVFFFITPINAGLKDLDLDMIAGIRVMGGRRWTVFRMAILPQQVLWITTTIKLAFPTAVATDIVAEFVAANQGLGFLMNSAAGTLDIASLLAEVVFVSVVVTVVIGIVSLLETRWFRWRATS
jgi:NitT/TauT family transport system permease protein